jgi:HD-like signal output (HDOD) protein/DNA-binding response OmpR family regulator
MWESSYCKEGTTLTARKPRILVVDDTPICREPLVALLNLQGFEGVSASNGREALARVRDGAPDVILLDLDMPDLDGWGVLASLRANPALSGTPVILLTGLSDKACVVRAARLGVRGYLLKSEFSLDQAMAKISECLTAATPEATPGVTPPAPNEPVKHVGAPKSQSVPVAPSTPPVSPSTRSQTVQRIQDRTQAKTLAGVVAEIVAMSSSPRGSMGDLVGVLKKDPVVAARVLQVANSARFATQRPMVSTLEEAVRNLGQSAVRNIATSVGVFEICPTGSADAVELVRCWQHAFAVAAVMDRLVPDVGGAGIAHLVGLCHDLGEIVLRQYFPQERNAAVAEAASADRPLRQTLAKMLGMSHHDFVGVVLARLGLPDPIVKPIREFHRDADAAAPNLSPLARALKLADNYAHGAMLAASGDAMLSPVSKADVAAYGGPDPMPEGLDVLQLRGEVLLTASLLSRLSAGDEQQLRAPVVEPTGLRIWYARHRSLAGFDPLAAALSLLGETAVHDGLPKSADEAADFQLLVVAVPRPGAAPFGLDQLEAAGSLAKLPVVCVTSAAGGAPPAAGPKNVRFATYPLSLASLREHLSAAAPLAAIPEPA